MMLSATEQLCKEPLTLQTFEVPKYDRSYDAVLQPARFDKSGEPVEPDLFAKLERRCHNCGSYAHLVQVCCDSILCSSSAVIS